VLFRFYRLRFRLRAREPIYFPPGKTGNTLRGAFGSIFRGVACLPGCGNVRRCELRASCAYARIFEPGAMAAGPSGLADWPRPFVFRAAHLDACSVPPGADFHFDLHLFEVNHPVIEFFAQAFAQLAHQGLGPSRGAAELTSIEQLDAAGSLITQVCDGAALPPTAVDLAPSGPVHRMRVRFLTPTELKTQQQLAPTPQFHTLFSRIRDRLSTLSDLYGAGPLPIEFKALGEASALISMTHCDLRRVTATRRSSRTGQAHSIGGFIGEAEYTGDLTRFAPYLQAAAFTGVGRHTTWGNGEIAVTQCDAL
jgi:hypothetical protein